MKNFLSTLTAGCICLLSLFTSCNSNENNPNTEKTVSLTKGMQFNFSFSDFNEKDTIEVSRASNIELQKETVAMGQLFTDVTLQRDTTRHNTPAQTRALSDGTYTIQAYQGGTLKGAMKGTITAGVFTATTPNQDIMLEPGSYRFVCCNDKVNVVGSTWTITQENAGKALIGVSYIRISPTPQKQQITFEMKHVVSKVTAGVITEGYPAKGVKGRLEITNEIPHKLTYDIASGECMYSDYAPVSVEMDGTRTGDLYLFPSWLKGGNFKLTLTAGTAYKLPIKNRSVRFSAAMSFEANKAYRLNYVLKYNYIYLYSDGSTGQYTDAAHKNKTPIAMVVSQRKKLAIALKDASDMRNGSYWHQGMGYDNTFSSANYADHLYDFNGEKYTWDPTYSKDGVTIKANNKAYVPFYAVAHYNPGVTITGSNIGKWFLPTLGEWNLFSKNLNLADNDFGEQFKTQYKYAPSEYGFYRANGTPIERSSRSNMGYNFYVSSSEHSQGTCYAWFARRYKDFNTSQSVDYWGGAAVVPKDGMGRGPHFYRPFIHY